MHADHVAKKPGSLVVKAHGHLATFLVRGLANIEILVGCALIVAQCLGQILNLEANREMYKVKVQVVQLEIIQGFIQTHRDVLWGMMGIPQLLARKIKHQSKRTLKCKGSPALTPVLHRSHLTDDEHVLAPDDALLHLGQQGLADVSLIFVAVGGVDVAIAGRNGSLYRALDRGAGEKGGLQQVKQVKQFQNGILTF